jgi:hypothetical protein
LNSSEKTRWTSTPVIVLGENSLDQRSGPGPCNGCRYGRRRPFGGCTTRKHRLQLTPFHFPP